MSFYLQLEILQFYPHRLFDTMVMGKHNPLSSLCLCLTHPCYAPLGTWTVPWALSLLHICPTVLLLCSPLGASAPQGLLQVPSLSLVLGLEELLPLILSALANTSVTVYLLAFLSTQ